MDIENPVKHLRWSFSVNIANGEKLYKIFNWVVNMPLNFEYISHIVLMFPLLILNK